jgi:hypothetical protein
VAKSIPIMPVEQQAPYNPDDYREIITIAIQDGTPEEPVAPTEPETPTNPQ